jgi:transposase
MDFNRKNFDKMLLDREVLASENEQLKTDVKILKEKVQFLLKKLFGRSSEKLNPAQLELAFEELRELQEALEEAETKSEQAEEEKKESKRGKRKPLDARIPEDLPTETIVIVPDEVLANPELYKKIGEETLEELDVTPTQYFRRITIREKFKLIGDRTQPPVIAPAPARLIPNSYASTGLILQIILSKYCDHLPLYRQEQILSNRHGIEISRKNHGQLDVSHRRLAHDDLRSSPK